VGTILEDRGQANVDHGLIATGRQQRPAPRRHPVGLGEQRLDLRRQRDQLVDPRRVIGGTHFSLLAPHRIEALARAISRCLPR
jgi:hypothetical protein